MTLDELTELGKPVGQQWYELAEQELRAVAEENGWNPVTFAAVLAITSPRVTLKRNIRYSLEWLANSNPLDMMTPVRAALDYYERTRQIRGPKTSAFKACLLGCPDSLVLDVHMARALDIPQEIINRKGPQSFARQRITRTASRHGLTIAQTQACVWAGQIQRTGRKPEYFPLRREYQVWQKYGYRFPLGSIN